MTWVPLLLADPSPCLRWLVLRDLLHLPSDHTEMLELESLRLSDPLLTGVLAFQEADGSWKPGSIASGGSSNRLLVTALALARLGYLGFGPSFPAVRRGAEFLFSEQCPDGSWPLAAEYEQNDDQVQIKTRERYSMMPLQTALPLRGLAACGYATDPRAERAYEWLLAQRLEDGAWPTGKASGVNGYVAGYRRLPHSRWGCRSNTTGTLLCLALHPQRRKSPEAVQALDHLLGRETHEAHTLGYEVARLAGAEPAHGFITFFARFDLAMVLSLAKNIGASRTDERLSEIIQFVIGQQGEYGLWEYPDRPQVRRWVTFDILRSLGGIDENVEWINMQPRTPFQPYPKRVRRF